jgi:hypothetical protein
MTGPKVRAVSRQVRARHSHNLEVAVRCTLQTQPDGV